MYVRMVLAAVLSSLTRICLMELLAVLTAAIGHVAVQIPQTVSNVMRSVKHVMGC